MNIRSELGHLVPPIIFLAKGKTVRQARFEAETSGTRVKRFAVTPHWLGMICRHLREGRNQCIFVSFISRRLITWGISRLIISCKRSVYCPQFWAATTEDGHSLEPVR